MLSFGGFLAECLPCFVISKRGFGDSTEVSDIRETTVVEDAHRALRYLRDTIGASSVIVWGHSQVLMMMKRMKTMSMMKTTAVRI